MDELVSWLAYDLSRCARTRMSLGCCDSASSVDGWMARSTVGEEQC